MTIQLSGEQDEAVTLCRDLSKPIVCITGQAGTGKTTIIQRIYDEILADLLDKFNMDADFYHRIADTDDAPFSIKISAPTGRAAKRISEATGLPAVTIHRMLRFSVPENDDDFGLPAYDKANRMPYDVIICDEASMITVELQRAIIDAMKKGCVVRFFGDSNQLPPIPLPGTPTISPFAEGLKRFPSVTLTHNYRSEDGIIRVSDAIIRNRMPISNDQVQVLRCEISSASRQIMSFAETIDFTRFENQIIIPTKRTTHGCEVINRLIQQKFNSETERINIWKTDSDGNVEKRAFKRGDKIIWDKNNYQLNIMNGTIGRVLDFDLETGTIWITTDDGDLEVPAQVENFNPTTGERYIYDPRTQMILAYAITTHKAQGSQFDTVLYSLARSRAATRQNVYTAVTRAKHKVIILNLGGALNYAIANLVKV